MATATLVPITVESDAAARVAELGIQREFEQMLDHARQTVPGLRCIRVTLEYDPHGAEEPGLVIWSHRDRPSSLDYDSTDEEWGMWFVTAFPPQVCRHLCMISIREDPLNGR